MTRILGILNLTPDSFSDVERWVDDTGVDVAGAVERARQMLREGAAAIDVGGVSTRPNAPPVSEAEELRRVLPVVTALQGMPVWVDTARARVAALAIEAGACGINDQRAGEDPELLRVVARAAVPYVFMHNRGTPETMRSLAVYDDVVAEVWSALDELRAQAIAAGISPEHCIADPGIGFAKTAEHSLALIRDLPRRRGEQVLLGASRKSFLVPVTGRALPADRLAGSLAVVAWAAHAGVSWVRVHDVAASADVLAVWGALA